MVLPELDPKKHAGPDIEHIPQDNIEGCCTVIGKVYGLPEEVVNRGKETQVILTDNKSLFIEEVRSSLKEHLVILQEPSRESRDAEVVLKYLDLDLQYFERSNLEDTVAAEVEKDKHTEGTFFIRQDGSRKILIKNNLQIPFGTALLHELIHSMGCKGFGKRSGLWFPTSKGSFCRNLNEAATELLRATLYLSLSPTKVKNPYKAVMRQISPHYKHDVKLLTTLMNVTHKDGGKPVGLETLIGNYFGLEGKDDEGPFPFLDTLFQGFPAQDRDATFQGWFFLATGTTFPEGPAEED